MSEILELIAAFLKSQSDEERSQIEAQLLEPIQALEDLVQFIQIILQENINVSIGWVVLSIIKRKLSFLWEETELQTRFEFLQHFHPILFLGNQFFESVLDFWRDLLCNSIYTFEIYHPIWESSLQNCSEIFQNLQNDQQIINFLQYLYILTRSLINYNKEFPNEIYDFIVGFTEQFIDINNYTGPVKCIELYHAFSTHFELTFHVVFRKTCEIDDDLQSNYDSCLEMLLNLLNVFSQTENPNDSQIKLLEFVVSKLSGIARIVLESDETEESELIQNCVEFSWNAFLISTEKTTDSKLQCNFAQLFIYLGSSFIPNIEQLSYLVTLLSLKQEELEKLAFEPYQFIIDNFCKTSDETEPLRDIIMQLLSTDSQYYSEEDLILIFQNLEISENCAVFATCFAKQMMKSEETSKILSNFVISYINSAKNIIDEVTSLFLLSKCVKIIDFSMHVEILAAHSKLLESNSAVHASMFAKYLFRVLKFFNQMPVDALVVKYLIENYGGSPSQDILRVFMLSCIHDERLLENTLIRDISTNLPTIASDQSESSILWTFTAVQCLTFIVMRVGDAACPELLFNTYSETIDQDIECLQEMAVLGEFLLKTNSSFSVHYVQKILEKFASDNMMFSYAYDFSNFFFEAVLHGFLVIEIFNFFSQNLNSIEDTNDTASALAILSLCTMFSNELDLSLIISILPEKYNEEDTVLTYMCNHFVACSILFGNSPISQEIINAFVQSVVSGQVCSYRDLHLYHDCFVKLGLTDVATEMSQNPKKYVQFNADMSETEIIMHLCIPTPNYNDEDPE